MRAISLARFCCTGRRLSLIGSFFSSRRMCGCGKGEDGDFWLLEALEERRFIGMEGEVEKSLGILGFVLFCLVENL